MTNGRCIVLFQPRSTFSMTNDRCIVLFQPKADAVVEGDIPERKRKLQKRE